LNATYEILFVAFKQSIFYKRNPSFWDPQKSWVFKWCYPLQPSEKKWYYFGVYPRYKERFPYSSTILVWTTDAWHLFKALMLGCIMVAIVNYSVIIHPFIDFILLYSTFTFAFEMFFSYILRKK
jgi:hypothetical protein